MSADETTGGDSRLFSRPWIFIKGVPSMRFLPPEGPPEIAFAGRSNVGKSSLINALCGEPVANIGSVLSETGRPSWYVARTPKGDLRLLDTRGIGDRSTIRVGEPECPGA